MFGFVEVLGRLGLLSIFGKLQKEEIRDSLRLYTEDYKEW